MINRRKTGQSTATSTVSASSRESCLLCILLKIELIEADRGRMESITEIALPRTRDRSRKQLRPCAIKAAGGGSFSKVGLPH